MLPKNVQPNVFAWAWKLADFVLSFQSFMELRSRWCSRKVSFSSSFSGIGALEVSLECLQTALNGCGVPSHFHSVSACEISPSCRSILRKRNAHLHIIPDIMDNFLGEIPKYEGCYHTLKQKMLSLRVCESCPCCSGERPQALVDVSGSPCQPHSRCGSRLKENDSRIVFLLAWMCLHKHLRTPVLIHENVVGFEERLLTEVLVEYHCFQLVLEPADARFNLISRKRVYHILIRRDIQVLQSPVDVFRRLAALFRAQSPQDIDWTWLPPLVSSLAQLRFLVVYLLGPPQVSAIVRMKATHKPLLFPKAL